MEKDQIKNEAKIKHQRGQILRTVSNVKEKNICSGSVYFSTTFFPTVFKLPYAYNRRGLRNDGCSER